MKMSRVRFPATVRYQYVDGLANEFLRRVAKENGDGRTGQHDLEAGIDHHHRIGTCGEDRVEEPFRF
jgi:hypothetical protein